MKERGILGGGKRRSVVAALLLFEAALLAGALFPMRPRRTTELAAAAAYRRDPSIPNRIRLDEERHSTDRLMWVSQVLIWSLVIMNGVFAFRVWRRKT